MKLATLLKPWIHSDILDLDVLGLQNDSRAIKPGELFLAYPGASSDGRHYIAQAVSKGAIAVLYDPQNLSTELCVVDKVPCFPMPGLSKKLALIAQRFYGALAPSMALTAVTGTNGKTTIAYQLAQAHELLHASSAYIGTLGQGSVSALQTLQNTTPDALCLQHLLHDYAASDVRQVCMEVSSHALVEGRVATIDFTQAIFTNLSHDHLDYHHTLEAYAAAKALLFMNSSLQYAIVNHDDAYAKSMISKVPDTCKILQYGLQDGCDVRAVDWQMTMNGSQFDILSPWGIHTVHVKAIGAFNVYNSLAVFTSLMLTGYDVLDVVSVMSQLHAAPGRLEIVHDAPSVIVDYAHTPDALENVLLTLSRVKRGRVLVVCGCGGDRDKTKRPIMARIASKYADLVILTSDNPRSEDPAVIIDEMAAGIVMGTNFIKNIDRAAAINQALAMAAMLDIVLIAGKGHEDYQIIGKQKLPFSDQDVARNFYKNNM